ncbi:MAG: V-type synthase subunit [Anaerophaga sp.]|uniref:V-type ATP synthase subunit D n=1 Tax=Anaerophaga thermohalophila TaxID=177400 RepID=UPI000237CE14|nr:V-type ATP synthase subunit D [Anaerophaga thermohalophila]MBZ4675561.1 V-type synthase subunit [Anaerophaga sp.]MDK2840761.1 V/A-type H+/Na+-transporting ATPase subunit [Anaerophaga sp.]MDN5290748.1 V/A-type H+/Na+-transporting ATPase subunit [Anaerophaga sp.]
MAIKFQYNKTSQQALAKQLQVRERALPTLKNKESALRMQVKNAKDKATELEEQLKKEMGLYDDMVRLWNEFDPSLAQIEDVELTTKKIAGVQTPVLEKIHFAVRDYNMFEKPAWFPDGIAILEKLVKLAIEKEVFERKMELLDFARKKTTQKVNLYEKVQIPGFQDAIRKIKRFLEDEENLSKAAQKIVKNRQQNVEVES